MAMNSDLKPPIQSDQVASQDDSGQLIPPPSGRGQLPLPHLQVEGNYRYNLNITLNMEAMEMEYEGTKMMLR